MHNIDYYLSKPYSASTMFVTYGIPSLFELQLIYDIFRRITMSFNSIISDCLAPPAVTYTFAVQHSLYSTDNDRDQHYFIRYFHIRDIFSYIL